MEFDASMKCLEDMMVYIRKQAYACGLDKHLIHKMELPCEEAIVNIISYAYPHGGSGKLKIDCEKNHSRFVVILRDHGVPFNPIDAEINPQLNQPIQDRKIGGLGIYLMRNVIDEACYQRLGDENVLRLAFQIR